MAIDDPELGRLADNHSRQRRGERVAVGEESSNGPTPTQPNSSSWEIATCSGAVRDDRRAAVAAARVAAMNPFMSVVPRP